MGISYASIYEQTTQTRKTGYMHTTQIFSLFSFLFQGFLVNQTKEKGKKENKPGGRIPCTSSWRNSCPCRRLPAPPHSSSSYLRPLALPELGLGFSSTLGLLRMLRMIPLGNRWSLSLEGFYFFSKNFNKHLF